MYVLATAPMADLAVNFEPYKTAGDYWLLDDYILVGDSDMLDLTFTLYSEEREDALNEISVPSVPFIGCDFIVSGPMHLTLKLDWLCAISRSMLLPNGPRVYFGFLFYH